MSSISLESLSPEELGQVRQQLETELQHLATAFKELKVAQGKFEACSGAIDGVEAAEVGGKILVPLTNSLYVPGKLAEKTLLVDIGTGYFVKKTPKAAKTLYNTKTLQLRSNLNTLQQQIESKNGNLVMVTRVLNAKLQQQQQEEQEQQEDSK